jgi:GNAT superfamily N-acetyltransferase
MRGAKSMREIPYLVLRTAMLSGHPAGSGQWLVNVSRLQHGEGVILEDDPGGMIQLPDDAPLVTPKSTSPLLQKGTSQFYRRIRNAADAVRHLQSEQLPFSLGCYTFASWAYPKDGIIPLPKEGESPLERNHSVSVDQWIAEIRHFRFRNSWGKWGYQSSGQGFLPYQYFDRYGLEAWASYYTNPMESVKRERHKTHTLVRWVVRDETYERTYGFEVKSPDERESWAWTFVREMNNRLEVEEFFVMPEHRRKGFANLLVAAVQGLIKVKGNNIVFWVPFADTRQESPSTFDGMVNVIRKFGAKFVPSKTHWIAYCAGTAFTDGANDPIEPPYIPSRLQSIHHLAILAALAGMPAPSAMSDPVAVVAEMDMPSIDSDAWDIMNEMRGELIEKQAAGTLTASESEGLEKLQFVSYEVLRRAYPASTELEERLRVIEDRLGETQ